MSTYKDKLSQAIAAQNREYDMLEALHKAYTQVKNTPVVDDDFPEVKRAYEAALADFLQACRNAGRLG